MREFGHADERACRRRAVAEMARQDFVENVLACHVGGEDRQLEHILPLRASGVEDLLDMCEGALGLLAEIAGEQRDDIDALLADDIDDRQRLAWRLAGRLVDVCSPDTCWSVMSPDDYLADARDEVAAGKYTAATIIAMAANEGVYLDGDVDDLLRDLREQVVTRLLRI